MLKSVTIENFRCLKRVEVPLRPLTVLVGPNDSVKSTLLTALYHLTKPVPFDPSDSWRLKPEAIVKVSGAPTKGIESLTVESGPLAQIKGRLTETSMWLPTSGKRPTYVSRDQRVSNPVGLYRLPTHGVPMQSRGYPDSGQPPEIGSDGGMIPALLDHLLRTDLDRFGEVVQALRDLVSGFEKLRIATPQPDQRRIDIVVENGLCIPADEASAGMRLLLFFVALAYHPSPPKLILIEEPENGVHPKRLADVMRLLREITQGKHGDHAAQVVMTTHSPHLLDYVDLDHDQVLVFRRNDDGSRSAEAADAERLKNFLDEFMLGEVWYNQGEAGLVGRP